MKPRLTCYLPSLLLSLLLIASSAMAQGELPEPTTTAEPGSKLTVYVMTMGPGDLVWERFGHNAIWIQDPGRGTDDVYNWGMFSFQQENFLLRFIRGEMLYWMQPFDVRATVAAYERDQRSVWVQELNLTPAERRELREFLDWNERPENAFYRYDYYRDNCSTRVRDAIDRVLGGRILQQTEALPTGETYRSHTRRLTASDIPTYSGLLLGLGQPVDREISAWEEMFLPLKLAEHLRMITTLDEAGREVPLVRSEEVVHAAPPRAIPDAPPSRVTGYLLVGLLIGGVLLLLGRHAGSRRWAGYAFGGVASLWALLTGTAGLILMGLWLFTDHTAAYRNENLLHFSPLALALVVLVPLAAVGNRRVAALTLRLALVVAALSALGLILKVLPGMDQVNGELIALALPVHVALAASLWMLLRSRGHGDAGDGPRFTSASRGLAAPAR